MTPKGGWESQNQIADISSWPCSVYGDVYERHAMQRGDFMTEGGRCKDKRSKQLMVTQAAHGVA